MNTQKLVDFLQNKIIKEKQELIGMNYYVYCNFGFCKKLM